MTAAAHPKVGRVIPNAPWQTVKIGDSLNLINGRAFKPSEWSTTGTPIVRIQNLNNPKAPFNYYQGDLPAKIALDDGDLLFAWSGTPGTSFGAHIWRGGKAWLNQHIFKVEFDAAQFDKRFLQLAINHNLNDYIRAAHGGAGLAHITKGKFEASELPCPPLTEQRRIVAEIEKQFTRVDVGVAALRRTQANLKRYRAAVLKAACEGCLVPTRIKFVPTPLKELMEGLGQGWSPKCDLHREPEADEWAIITTTAVQPMRYVDYQGKPLPSNLTPRPHIEIKVGDFLMTRKGPRNRTGVACLVRSTRHRLMVCDTVYRFRCREARVKAAYLELALNSPPVVEEINRRKSGISDSGISLTHDKIGGVPIPLPPLAEQTRIVAEVERRLSVVDELETVVNANLQRATRLRQSIPNQAFTGNL